MADFTSTSGDDNFVATSGPDRFFFGENQGVDLIVNFDPAQDKLVYTDRSVDGFDDIGISRLSNGDTAVESNDQVTVLKGIRPDQLRDSDFVFTTSGPRYTIDRARENNDVPNEVSVRNINQREAQYSGSSSGSTSSGSSGSGGDSHAGAGHGTSGGNALANLLHKAGLTSGLKSAMLSHYQASTGPSASATDVSKMTQAGTSLHSLFGSGSADNLLTALLHGDSVRG